MINFGEQPGNYRNGGKGARKNKVKENDKTDGRATGQNAW